MLASMQVGCQGEVTLPNPIESGQVCDDGVLRVEEAPLLRLTRLHYDNSIRDILGVTTSPGGALEDEKLDQFSVNSFVAVSETVARQYMTAAESVATQAVVDVDTTVGCDRAALGDGACASEFIARFGRRAYRRPLTGEEVTAYEGLYTEFSDDEGYANGIRLVITAMLQSPNFLYRPELLSPDATAGEVVACNDFELATRLAFFLWASSPDDELLDAAEAGELTAEGGLSAHVERMLNDPRTLTSIGSFHTQWLGLDALEGTQKDPRAFPEWTPALRDAMRSETEVFAANVIVYGDGTLSTLLTSSETNIRSEMFPIYGLIEPAGHDPTQPVALDPAQRAGIVTQPGLLAAQSHNSETSPTLRGRLIREHFFCFPLEDPPEGIDTTPPPPQEGGTLRDRLSQHMDDPACRSCHVLSDGIGFGFENFDPIGRWRTTDNSFAINAEVELVSTDIDGTYADAVQLAHAMAQSEQVSNCVATNWFKYAVGRQGINQDECSVRGLQTYLSETDDLRGLMTAIVTSDAFLYRRL